VEAFFEAADSDLERLIVEAIGPKPVKYSDEYYGAIFIAKRAVKQMANDEDSIRFTNDIDAEFTLTKYKKDYAWGTTLNFTGKNAFNATVKNFVNVYVANGSMLDVLNEPEPIANKNLRIALETAYKGQQE
jgi:hypothetical protein